ncbi:MAG: ATP-binding cassette domain-containing protein [Saprospiraceae bacterium]|nr:ATP-binding cassette domain-containing protein [Saprospiraceae bacterium]
MEVKAENLSKRYLYQWVIKDFNYYFQSGNSYAISGANGSGKSTLIKLLSGFLSSSEGSITYSHQTKDISIADIYKHLVLTAPYTDLILEYTMEEMFNFHTVFKPFKQKVTFKQFEDIIELKTYKEKQIRFFSSGMKQKVQLALSVLSDSSLLMLDEPTSYLDSNAKKWFKTLFEKQSLGKTIILASNDPFDIDLCESVIKL